MKTQLVKLSKIAAYSSLTLGAIHTVATIVIIKQLASLNPEFRGTFLFMYVAAGLGCLLAGASMLLSTNLELRKVKTSHHIFLISAIFMLLLGIGAPIAMRNNPFGYISLATGVFATVVALLSYKKP